MADTNPLVISGTRTHLIHGLPGAQLDCPLADRDASNQNTKFIHFAGKWRPHPSDAGDAGDWTSAGHDPDAFFFTTLERNELVNGHVMSV